MLDRTSLYLSTVTATSILRLTLGKEPSAAEAFIWATMLVIFGFCFAISLVSDSKQKPCPEMPDGTPLPEILEELEEDITLVKKDLAEINKKLNAAKLTEPFRLS